MTPTVETRGLTLRYGDTTAVDGLTVTFEGGRIHGLLGRNGAGKTSLLSVMAGFRDATDGEALIDGEPVFENPRAMSQTCLIRSSGDTVDHDWPADRVRDALALAAAMRPNWDDAYAARLLDRFEVDRRKRVGELSRGKRSALAVTLGLASRAPVTLFDESYLGMDAPSRYAFYDELLADIMAHPRTVVISTHLIEEVARLFERVIIIDRGQLLLADDADAVRARGASLTGPALEVDGLVGSARVLASRQLGPTKQVTVYGELADDLATRARQVGVEVGPATLQDLFVHLTDPETRQPAYTTGGAS